MSGNYKKLFVRNPEVLPQGFVYYIASPLTLVVPRVKAVWWADMLLAALVSRGVTAVSTVTMYAGTEAYLKRDNKLTPDEWMRHCLRVLRACDALIFAELPGCRESRGMAQELEWCLAHNKPVWSWRNGLLIPFGSPAHAPTAIQEEHHAGSP